MKIDELKNVSFYRKKQHTIGKQVSTVGLGLHSGKRATLVLKPALPNTGIVFRRVDCAPSIEIPAHAIHIGDVRLASVLEKEGVRVSTVEHLLSACCGLGVDNLCVEIDNEEIPIMDGSAATFVYLLREANIVNQEIDRKYLAIQQSVEVTETKNGLTKWAKFTPYSGFKLSFNIEFNHPKIQQSGQSFEISFTQGDEYEEGIARARTFGFMHEVEMLRGMGLARGGSLENAIVMDEFSILNEGEMRYFNEFVRHKILDAIGDLYLIGYPLLAHYEGYKAGHDFNNRLLRKVLSDSANYKIITI